jgi:CHAT domain-containing protein/tetratricopeptide (TPR) repeat protein
VSAGEAAAALAALARLDSDPEVVALAAWVGGMACQLEGQMQTALAHLDQASALFSALGQTHTAASVDVSRVTALAILGRYEEGIACGMGAREVFVRLGDQLSAGKIESNLGGIHFRRDQYREAERLLRSARERFLAVGDHKELAKNENNIAIVLTMQHRHREAASLYEQALERARDGGLEVLQAEIEEDLGQLALNQGHYDRALDRLERARRRFANLGMQHFSACAEKGLADAYLELNLAPEAVAAYERALEVFGALNMRAEQAAALAGCGRASALAGEPDTARNLLAEARRLYLAEDNEVGQATVTLAEAGLQHADGRFEEAVLAASLAEAPLVSAGTWGRALLARWLRGDALRALRQTRAARRLLQETLSAAERRALPQIAQRCETSLGLLASAAGDAGAAEAAFKRAIGLIEELRAPLPAEDFRTAFVADKLLPYAELVRLCLADPCQQRTAEALGYVERARSRALVDLLGGALPAHLRARDAFEAELLRRLSELREDLNWLYSQFNRPSAAEQPPAPETVAELHVSIRDGERSVLEILRQLQQCSSGTLVRVEPLDLEQLQQNLGPHTALVEYYLLDDEVLAFVVTGDGVSVVRGLATRQAVDAALDQLRFQLGALRGGSERVRAHLDQLGRRTRHYLGILHDLLLGPVEPHLGSRRLVVVPHETLHYVPFHALFDGQSYAIERREVCYSPSASVLRHCFGMPRRALRRALLVGVPDERTPRVQDEVTALAGLFPESVSLVGPQATRAALQEHTAEVDLVHLACHGQFRPDNPMFSALRLGDGWLTVREAYELDLDGKLVTLSACETGASAVAPGDELIGLVRGFFSAGAPTLLVSMWTVDDDATADLMADVYASLRAGTSPASALREAQCRALSRHQHPFFWAPFALFGRW